MTYFREETKTHDIALTDEQMIVTAPSVFAEQPYHEVSDRYGFIPTIEVIDSLRKEGWFPVDATQKNVRTAERRDFTKHLVRFRRLQNDILIGDSAVELILTNSHDRSSGFILHAGIFRMACANGIVIADSTFKRVSVRHSRYSAERVIEGSYEVMKEVPEITNEVESMQAIELLPQEQNLLAMTAFNYGYDLENITTSEHTIAQQMLRPKRAADNGNDLWTTFNKVQEKMLRGGIRYQKKAKESKSNRRGFRNSTTREVKSIDKNIKLNKALWEMAQQMRAIKEAA